MSDAIASDPAASASGSPRWTAERVEQACRTLIPGYNPWLNSDGFYFDAAAALRVVQFFEEVLCFTVAKWAGKPFKLQPWQAAVVGNLFGWKRRSDHTRRYRKCLLFTARKSGKTELAAGIGLVLLFIDREPMAEIVAAAGNADQATRVFNAAATMVRYRPALSDRAEVFVRSIQAKTRTGGFFKVINAAAKTKHGGNLHAALIDELHVHPDAELVDVLETSMGVRTQPMVLYTTTAGENPESIAGEVYDYATKIRDRIAEDPEFLPVVYEVPREADISDPKNWALAQPSLGVTVPVAKYEQEYLEAKAVPRKLQRFRQLLCNQWTENSAAWIGLDDWRKCAGEVDLQKLKGKRACLGIDLSSTTDTTSVVAAVEDGPRVLLIPFIFIPRENAEGRFRRQKRDHAPYVSWLAQNLIIATEGNVVDYAVVEQKIYELRDLLNVEHVAADPYNATDLLTRLGTAGLDVVKMRQGYSLSAATKETERLILNGHLVHGNNPAFTWQMSNVALKQDTAENCWPDKQKSYRRIDAAVASVMAINALKFSPDAEKKPTTADAYLSFL